MTRIWRSCEVWIVCPMSSNSSLIFWDCISFSRSSLPCGPINQSLYYMEHWFTHWNNPATAVGKRFIGFLGWLSLVAMVNREAMHAPVSVCWLTVGLSLILTIPVVCNGAPVGAGIFHQVRIRALFLSRRGSLIRFLQRLTMLQQLQGGTQHWDCVAVLGCLLMTLLL